MPPVAAAAAVTEAAAEALSWLLAPVAEAPPSVAFVVVVEPAAVDEAPPAVAADDPAPEERKATVTQASFMLNLPNLGAKHRQNPGGTGTSDISMLRCMLMRLRCSGRKFVPTRTATRSKLASNLTLSE